MKWNQFRLKTTTQAEDIVSSMLADLGIEGVQIEDKVPLTALDKEQMFVDILPDIPEDDGTAYLTFYLEEDENKEEILRSMTALCQAAGTPYKAEPERLGKAWRTISVFRVDPEAVVGKWVHFGSLPR